MTECINNNNQVTDSAPIPIVADPGALNVLILAYTSLLRDQLQSVNSAALAEQATEKWLDQINNAYAEELKHSIQPEKGESAQEVFGRVQDRMGNTTLLGNLTQRANMELQAQSNGAANVLKGSLTGAKIGQNLVTTMTEAGQLHQRG